MMMDSTTCWTEPSGSHNQQATQAAAQASNNNMMSFNESEIENMIDDLGFFSSTIPNNTGTDEDADLDLCCEEKMYYPSSTQSQSQSQSKSRTISQASFQVVPSITVSNYDGSDVSSDNDTSGDEDCDDLASFLKEQQHATTSDEDYCDPIRKYLSVSSLQNHHLPIAAAAAAAVNTGAEEASTVVPVPTYSSTTSAATATAVGGGFLPVSNPLAPITSSSQAVLMSLQQQQAAAQVHTSNTTSVGAGGFLHTPNPLLNSGGVGLKCPPTLYHNHQQVEVQNQGQQQGQPQQQQQGFTAQTVLEQQRVTIQRNQQIINAQQNKLVGQQQVQQQQQQQQQVVSSSQVVSSTSNRVAVNNNNKRPYNSSTTTTATAANNNTSSNSNENKNSYMKWKCTAAGATKLKALESAASNVNVNQQQQQQAQIISSSSSSCVPGSVSLFDSSIDNDNNDIDDMIMNGMSNKLMTPELLEVRRERNRKHAKKSRQRKKSLTSTLEQSLDDLKEENTKLRKCVQNHIDCKKIASTMEANHVSTVDELLEIHRVRSHERFIQCILSPQSTATTTTTTTSNDDSEEDKDKNNDREDTASITPLLSTSTSLPSQSPSLFSTRSGKGVIVDDKTLKLLKAFSKAVVNVASSASNQDQSARKRQKKV